MSIVPNEEAARTDRPPSAFSLVEVAIALGICAFVLIALFGLLQASLVQHRQSIEESLAINLSQLIVQDLRQGAADTNTNYVLSTNFALPLTNGGVGQVYLTEGGAKAGNSAQARFLVKTSVTRDNDLNGKGRRVSITFWAPAAAAPAPLTEVVASLKSGSTNF